MWKWVSLGLILLLSLFMYEAQDSGITLNETFTKLKPVYDVNEKVFTAIPYKNPYQTNFSLKDFAINTIHIAGYPIIMEFHNIIGASFNLLWDFSNLHWALIIFRIIMVYIVIRLIFAGIKPFGIIYILVDEYWMKKYNKKLNVWITISISITILAVLVCIVILLMLLWGWLI